MKSLGIKRLVRRRWYDMMQRCYNKQNRRYSSYGGRGIHVCRRWHKAENFIADMLPSFKEGLSLERIDNNEGYSKDNCAWVTLAEQSRNRRTNRRITYKGKTQCLVAWANEYSINKGTLFVRLLRGWSFHKAITTSIQSLRLYTINGVTKPLARWARVYDIPKGVVYSRVLRYNWPIEEALGLKPHKDKQIVFTIAGVTKTFSDWVRETNIPKPTVWSRIKRGVPIEVALELV